MKRILTCALLLLGALASGAREVQTLSDGWSIKPISQNQKNQQYTPVTLPHTWNAEYIEGTFEYNRETMVYRRNLPVSGPGRRFLYFEGANSVCQVFVNYHYVGEHKGGYTAFCFEITPWLKDGDNLIEVWVSNAWRPDVIPLIGDFNVCGGLHRPVHLIKTADDCIDPLFYASPGVFVVQKEVSAEKVSFDVKTLVNSKDPEGLALKLTILDPDGKQVAERECKASASSVESFTLDKPALWDGLGKAALYTVTAELCRNGKAVDAVSVQTGWRSLAADADRGIILNGRPYQVRGVCRHEDFAGRGSALLPENYETDFRLLREIGATGIRLAHYPHAERVYDFADKEGLLVWTEIPWCGPGGFQFTGFVDSPEFRHNASENLKELVWQKFNHPSICFWGIFNEIIYTDGKRFTDYGDPEPFARELGKMYKELDPSRLTCFATCEDESHYLGIADLVAWNKYFGWYERDMTQAEKFFDDLHANSSPYPVGISEYGAGASINHHQWPIDRMKASKGTFHPEERQSIAHEDNWAIIKARPWMWGTFVWNFADFRSNVRREGDLFGMNDKGLVTYDRSVCKDAFYFYKAEWNPEPMVYICSRRWTERTEAETCVRVYSNQRKATLYVNGVKIGERVNDGMSRFIWEGVTLRKGDNEIKVVAGKGKKAISDSCKWTLK